MINTICFEGETWELVNNGTYEVALGVQCDNYEIIGNAKQDLAVIHMASNAKTPKQLVVNGEQTIELFMSGEGKLIIEDTHGEMHVFHFDNTKIGKYVKVKIGEKMQWIAGDMGMQFVEICTPPYREGRFVAVTENEAPQGKPCDIEDFS